MEEILNCDKYEWDFKLFLEMEIRIMLVYFQNLNFNGDIGFLY